MSQRTVGAKGSERYGQRGGSSLSTAWIISRFAVERLITVDLGASTAVFHTTAFFNAARRAFTPVDVGQYGHLAWKLRQDPRVTVMEKTRARIDSASGFPRV